MEHFNQLDSSIEDLTSAKTKDSISKQMLKIVYGYNMDEELINNDHQTRTFERVS